MCGKDTEEPNVMNGFLPAAWSWNLESELDLEIVQFNQPEGL